MTNECNVQVLYDPNWTWSKVDPDTLANLIISLEKLPAVAPLGDGSYAETAPAFAAQFIRSVLEEREQIINSMQTHKELMRMKEMLMRVSGADNLVTTPVSAVSNEPIKG